MENLSDQLDLLKSQYRQIFLEYAKSLQDEVYSLKPQNFEGEIFDSYDVNSTGRDWQNKVLNLINQKLNDEIASNLGMVATARESCHCVGCGVCCKFAVSEFSPEELSQKAKNGDSLALQFINTFVPYSSLDEAGKVFPEYVEMLKFKQESEYFIYHCPKVTDDNRCPEYANRPKICRDFPDNPIAFLPLTCGYRDWKTQSEPIMLKLNAMAEILNYYKNNLEKVI